MSAEFMNSTVPLYIFLVTKIYCCCCYYYYYYYYLGDKIENEMGGACSAYGGEKRGATGF